MFRGDFITFIVAILIFLILGAFTSGIGSIIAGIVWAFFYNGYYTRRLLERGYAFADSDGVVSEAKLKLGVA